MRVCLLACLIFCLFVCFEFSDEIQVSCPWCFSLWPNDSGGLFYTCKCCAAATRVHVIVFGSWKTQLSQSLPVPYSISTYLEEIELTNYHKERLPKRLILPIFQPLSISFAEQIPMSGTFWKRTLTMYFKTFCCLLLCFVLRLSECIRARQVLSSCRNSLSTPKWANYL